MYYEVAMKRIIAIMLLCLAAASLFACGESKKKEEDTTAKADWRNTVEYEGAFYVNEKLRVLYAFDTGSITLWDNGGNGTVLQTIKYDTTVSDAIERIEKEDFNNDGNRDIRIIYSESEEGVRYSLFLWSEKTGHFAECNLYNEITDPVIDPDTGHVINVLDKGIFGTVTKEYAFNESSGLDEVSCTIAEADKVALAVADETLGGVARRSEGSATIDGVDCPAYIVSKDGKDIAYMCHTPDSVWYVDYDRLGFYRLAEEKDGAVVLTEYTGEGGVAQDIAYAVKGCDIDIISYTLGEIEGADATAYALRTKEGESLWLVTDERGYWYFSEDGETYLRVSAATGEAAGPEKYEFAIAD